MKKFLAFVAVLFVVGCTPTEVRELSTLELATIKAYRSACDVALDNNGKVIAALKAQGKISDSEAEQRIGQIEKVRSQGEALEQMHTALDKWIQVQGPAEAARNALIDVVPLIPDIVKAVKDE